MMNICIRGKKALIVVVDIKKDGNDYIYDYAQYIQRYDRCDW